MSLPELNVVHQADAVDFFNALPDGCIQTVVTSEPYWGLRVYGTPPTVWPPPSALDGDRTWEVCEHEWATGLPRAYVPDVGSTSQIHEGRTFQRGHLKVFGTNRNFIDEGGRGSNNPSITSESAFYSKCGAWRGHYGLEPTIDLYVAHTVMWMRALRPKLRDDGTVWLNLGDSYTSQPAGNLSPSGFSQTRPSRRKGGVGPETVDVGRRNFSGLKPKDLVMMPARVALALQADGWWLRMDIVWAKPNPMPESVNDRPTKAHEYVFLLTKSKNYFYDADAVREAQTGDAHPRRKDGLPAPGKAEGGNWASWRDRYTEVRGGRNLRSVWRFPTQPYSGAHFATFPDALPRTCILAGSSPQACPECGGPWERVVGKNLIKHGGPFHRGAWKSDGVSKASTMRDGGVIGHYEVQTLGFRPTCKHYDNQYLRDFPQARGARKQYQHWVAGNWWKRVRKRPGKAHWAYEKQVVCDPFAGTATTGVVAIRHGRDFLGCDLMGGDKDFERGPGGVEHHTANERLAATAKGLTLREYQEGQGVLWHKEGG